MSDRHAITEHGIFLKNSHPFSCSPVLNEAYDVDKARIYAAVLVVASSFGFYWEKVKHIGSGKLYSKWVS